MESAHLKVMCFDKTGTLTEDKVEVNRVLNFKGDKFEEIKLDTHRKYMDFKIFASCHTVK